VNALCASCHPAQEDGRHVTSLLAGKGHVVGGDLNDPQRQGRDFSCASCHNPHGSDNPKLFYYGENSMEACAWCHGDKSGKNPGLKSVTSRARRAPATQGAGSGSGSGSGSGDVPPQELR
jgi:predicted CXXCH cytochrome family protein